MTRDSAGLMKGTLDLLVLKALAGRRRHGYGITAWLERRSDGRLAVEDSAIYQSLHRLQGRRLVEPEWGTTENNRRARYYRLTAAGKKALSAEADVWREYADSVAEILALEEG